MPKKKVWLGVQPQYTRFMLLAKNYKQKHKTIFINLHMVKLSMIMITQGVLFGTLTYVISRNENLYLPEHHTKHSP